MEYKDEASYFLFSENKTQKGETHYNTHSHPRYEIMFSAEGGVEYVVENRRHELKKGDVLLVKPGLLHFAKRITCAPSLRYCIGFFPESIENGDLAKRIFDKGEHFALGRDSVFAELVSALRHKLENSYNDARTAAEEMVAIIDDFLFLQTGKPLPFHKNSSPFRFLFKIYVKTNSFRTRKKADVFASAFFISYVLL